jgi:hypothetical protein
MSGELDQAGAFGALEILRQILRPDIGQSESFTAKLCPNGTQQSLQRDLGRVVAPCRLALYEVDEFPHSHVNSPNYLSYLGKPPHDAAGRSYPAANWE